MSNPKPVCIRNLTRRNVIADKAGVADNPLRRMQGLLGRHFLPPGEGLIITQCQSVHMLFMKFAIDVIFINKDKQVIGVCPYLQPFQFSPIFWKSSCAIELPAGTIKRKDVQVGDQLQF